MQWGGGDNSTALDSHMVTLPSCKHSVWRSVWQVAPGKAVALPLCGPIWRGILLLHMEALFGHNCHFPPENVLCPVVSDPSQWYLPRWSRSWRKPWQGNLCMKTAVTSSLSAVSLRASVVAPAKGRSFPFGAFHFSSLSDQQEEWVGCPEGTPQQSLSVSSLFYIFVSVSWFCKAESSRWVVLSLCMPRAKLEHGWVIKSPDGIWWLTSASAWHHLFDSKMGTDLHALLILRQIIFRFCFNGG